MTYPDIVQIATFTSDGYDDKTVTVLTDCKANFIRRKGLAHENNADGVISDAVVYLEPTNAVIAAKMEYLEGMLIKYRNNWYSIFEVHIAERKLLNNAIDNVYCSLQKEAGVAYVTYVS